MFVDLLINILSSPLFQGSLVCTFLVLVYHSHSGPNLYRGFPTVGIDTSKSLVKALNQARENWAIHGKEILDGGMKQVIILLRLVCSRPGLTYYACSSQDAFKSSRTPAQRSCCRTSTLMRSETTPICISAKPSPRYGLCRHNACYA